MLSILSGRAMNSPVMFARISLIVVLFLRAHAICVSAQTDYEQNLIAVPDQCPVNHGSSIVELSDHNLLCCWYGGSNECAPDIKIYSSRYDSATKTWSAPAVVAAHNERAEGRWLRTKTFGNCALFIDDENVVWLFYAALPLGGWSSARVDYKTSRDNGQTWSPAKVLVGTFCNLLRNKPLRLGPGKFTVPLYQNFGHKYGYTCTLTVSGGEIKSKTYERIDGPENTQPSLVQRSEKELVAYLRDPTWQSLLFSHCDPADLKWSTAERLQLPNPNAAIDAVQSDDGKTLLVYNDSKKGRNPLSLAYSENGRDFKKIWDFEYSASGGSFSYPAIIKTADGSYHLTYSHDRRSAIKHVHFSQAWLSEKIAAAR
jgi:predicted neuraminidase